MAAPSKRRDSGNHGNIGSNNVGLTVQSPVGNDGTCEHLSYELVGVAAELVNMMQLPPYNEARRSSSNGICIHCGVVGDFGDTEYLVHYCVETNHWLAVRWVEPMELYCFFCGDFQYSAYFDRLIGKNIQEIEEFDRHFFSSICSPCSPLQRMPIKSTSSNNGADNTTLSLPTSESTAGVYHLSATENGHTPHVSSEGGRKRKAACAAAPSTNPTPTVHEVDDLTLAVAHSVDPRALAAREEVMESYLPSDAPLDEAEAARFQAQLLLQLTSPRSVTGITNLGATCFMNSVLQSIMHNSVILSSASNLFKCNKRCTRQNLNLEFLTTEDRQLLSIDRNSIDKIISNGCIACDFREVVVSAADAGEYNHQLSTSKTSNKVAAPTGSTGRTLLPGNLLYSVWSRAKHMAGYEQQDAHEFLIALLDGIGAHLEASHNEASGESQSSSSGGDVCRGRSGFVGEVFAGHLLSNLMCRSCSHRSSKQETFLDLSLSLQNIAPADISSAMSKQSRNSVSLSDCLRQYTSQEALSELIMCTKCHSPQPAYKQLQIGDLPKVLIVHLKRFDAVRKTKLGTHVNFQLRGFDLTQYCDGAAARSGATYDLQALICHRGSLNQGHYIAYISVEHASVASDDMNYKRNYSASGSSNVWLRCDDELITVVDEREVEKSEAYLLFYIKRS